MDSFRNVLKRLSVGVWSCPDSNGKPTKEKNGLVCHHCNFGGGMAYLHRLIALCLVLFSCSVLAQTVPVVEYIYDWGSWNTNRAAACSAGQAGAAAANPSCGIQNYTYNDTTGACGFTYTCNGQTGSLSFGSRSTCPANTTLTNGSCVSNVNAEDQACRDVAVIQNSSFSPGAINLSYVGDVPNGDACVPTSGSSSGRGCTAKFIRVSAHRTSATAPWISTGTAEMNNGTSSGCSLAPVAPTPSTPSTSVTSTLAPSQTCPPGEQRGTINGVSVCKPYGTTTETKTDSVKNEVSTSPTGVTSTSSISETTTCKDGLCSTAKTSSINGGAPTTSRLTQSQAGFCTLNPKVTGCNDSKSAFGGSCGSPPVCSGDAVQCAAASAAFTTACVLDTKANAESALYEAAKALDKNSSVITATNTPISSALFNSTNIFGSGSGCISDKSVTISGYTMSFPFSKICPFLEYIGFLNLAIAFALAGRIVTRG